MALCIWMLLSSCLGFWSLSEVKSQAEAIDAESADHEGLLGNAKLTAASMRLDFNMRICLTVLTTTCTNRLGYPVPSLVRLCRLAVLLGRLAARRSTLAYHASRWIRPRRTAHRMGDRGIRHELGHAS